MENVDKQEIREMLQDIMSGYNARIESQNNITNYKLTSIEVSVLQLINRISKVEDDVKVLQSKNNEHILNCPQTKKIETLQKEIDKQSNIKTFLFKALGVMVAAITIIYTFFRMYKGL